MSLEANGNVDSEFSECLFAPPEVSECWGRCEDSLSCDSDDDEDGNCDCLSCDDGRGGGGGMEFDKTFFVITNEESERSSVDEDWGGADGGDTVNKLLGALTLATTRVGLAIGIATLNLGDTVGGTGRCSSFARSGEVRKFTLGGMLTFSKFVGACWELPDSTFGLEPDKFGPITVSIESLVFGSILVCSDGECATTGDFSTR